MTGKIPVPPQGGRLDIPIEKLSQNLTCYENACGEQPYYPATFLNVVG